MSAVEYFGDYEQFQQLERLKSLVNDLPRSDELVVQMMRQGVTNRDEILNRLKQELPNLWDIPESEPLIDFVFS